MRQNPDANAEVLDIEDLHRIGESRTVCPYYLARWVGALPMQVTGWAGEGAA